MSDEAESGGSSPEQPETPKEQPSEIHTTLTEYSKFISDNFDKLYEEIELLKVKYLLILVSTLSWRMKPLLNSTLANSILITTLEDAPFRQHPGD